MASKAFLIAVIAAIVVGSAMAKEIVVGSDIGWRLGVDYQSWADALEFHVGDPLVFNYMPRAHNVIKVNGSGFEVCTAPLDAAPLTTGHDVITLATPGKKWYICGVGHHCQIGPMKFSIIVQHAAGGSWSPSPAPSPASAAAYNNWH